MLDAIKSKTIKTILMLSLAVNVICGIENLAIYGASKAGWMKGEFVTPSVAFGGFDAEQHQQLAMLGGAIDEGKLKPLPEKPVQTPVPSRKPLPPVR